MGNIEEVKFPTLSRQNLARQGWGTLLSFGAGGEFDFAVGDVD